MKKNVSLLKRLFPFSGKDLLITALLMGGVTALCLLLRAIDQSDSYQSMLFILAVMLVARFTNGYLFGTLASCFGVLAVNLLFTYPYYQFNFTLSGYPITILCMLAVAIGTGTLTTRIKQHSALLLETEKEKMRGNLLRAVSHDLRTPLTSISGATAVMLENDGDLSREDRLKLLSEVNEDAQWLIRMVENLLSITRIDGERVAKIKKSPEAAEEVVAEATAKFQKRFPETDVQVTVPEEFLLIPMDAMLIQQVIINLLENAVLHGKGADEIRLAVEKRGQQALFSVSDNGCGIDPLVLPHIFESSILPHDDGESDNRRNMGIGLSVCNTIIRAHNGKMTAENLQSGGAVFTFTLPLEDFIYGA